MPATAAEQLRARAIQHLDNERVRIHLVDGSGRTSSSRAGTV
ncbi:MAG TPA: hypothetical protein VLM11_21135 [Streptosporangiaceae bacterium]|nr:hypothetical protein [Streptosporangiaceae bacterium]